MTPAASTSVSVRSRPLRRLRIELGLTRWVFYILATVGVLATLRFTIAPPSPGVAKRPVVAQFDRAAEGFAVLFAHVYLAYDTADPDARRAALAPFTGQRLDPDVGLELPETGRQRVLWAQVVQERVGAPGERVYTVAAQTDRSGLIHLSVAVRRDREGGLSLGGYPALVGQPIVSRQAREQRRPREVQDRALEATVRRALGNYLAGSAANLAADLSGHARVALPGLRLVLERVTELVWAPGGASVLVTVRARGADGTGWTLRYELDVTRGAGRWEIGAIQMDPTS